MGRFCFIVTVLAVVLGCAGANPKPVAKEVTVMGKVSQSVYDERNKHGYVMFGLLPDESMRRPLIYCEMREMRHVSHRLLPAIDTAAERKDTITLHGTINEQGALVVTRAVFKDTAFRRSSFLGLPRWEITPLNQ